MVILILLLCMILGSLYLLKNAQLRTFGDIINPFSDTDSTENNKVDCSLATRYCTQDSHCKVLCHGGNFSCDLETGTCQLKVLPAEQGCNENHGFVHVLETTELTSRWACLNTLPHLFNDDGSLRPYVCGEGLKVGKFDLNSFNVREQDINITTLAEKCSCAKDHTRAYDLATRNIPLCVPKSMIDTFSTTLVAI